MAPHFDRCYFFDKLFLSFRAKTIVEVEESYRRMIVNNYWVYILANWNNSVLYVGMTGNLEKRLIEHRNKVNPDCFTAKYNCTKCVFFEVTNDPYNAITREKQIKNWNRAKKDWLIGKDNPEWKELVP